MSALVAIYVLLAFATAETAKILAISHIFSNSHHISFVPIVEAIADRGHEISFLTYYNNNHPNVTMLKLAVPDDVMGDEEFMKNFVLNVQKRGPLLQIWDYIDFAQSNCNSLLKDEHTQKLLKSGKQFDVAIVEPLFGQCPMALASLLAKHTISYYTSPWPLQWMDVDLPLPPSYVPNMLQRLPSKLNFWQRLRNVYTYLGVGLIQKYGINAALQNSVTKYLPGAPRVEDVEKLVDFNLVNSDPVSLSPRPSMPKFAAVGAMHCREAKPLPKEFTDFVEDSGDDGFIIFGLGSNVKSQFLSAEFLEVVISAFSRLKQKIIWKFEAQLNNLPKNIKITKWMPQQDLLGHPKARLFITHAGLLSVQEAIYHGVPVIGMPFFADQPSNVVRMKDLGIGEILDFFNVTNESLYPLINQVLSDKRYSENMKKYSLILKDQLHKPVDNAVYWVEYIIRHDGAHHLRSGGEDLNFIQLYLLDIIAFLMLMAFTIVVLVVLALKFIFLPLLGQKYSATKQKMKQK